VASLLTFLVSALFLLGAILWVRERELQDYKVLLEQALQGGYQPETPPLEPPSVILGWAVAGTLVARVAISTSILKREPHGSTARSERWPTLTIPTWLKSMHAV
jgi:hypothetical protein